MNVPYYRAFLPYLFVVPSRGNNSRQTGQRVNGRPSQSWSHNSLSYHKPENQNDMLSGDNLL